MENKKLKAIYRQFYSMKLADCEKAQTDTEQDLYDAVAMAMRARNQLTGMQMLLEAYGCIGRDESRMEEERIKHDFDTSRLYGAIMLSNGMLFHC